MSILMKEMAMLSVVLGPYFASTRGGFGVLGCDMVRDCNTDKYPLEGFDMLMCGVYAVAALYYCVRLICPSTPADSGKPYYNEGDDGHDQASASLMHQDPVEE